MLVPGEEAALVARAKVGTSVTESGPAPDSLADCSKSLLAPPALLVPAPFNCCLSLTTTFVKAFI